MVLKAKLYIDGQDEVVETGKVSDGIPFSRFI